MDRVRIESFLGGLPQVRALVLGDLMLDEYIWGRTERISPEAPVQVVDVLRENLLLGGAGNVVNNLACLGCRVDVASVVGDDADGRRLLQMMQGMGVGVEALFCSAERTTTRKTRILASHQQMLRLDRENRTLLTPADETSLLEALRSKLADYQIVFISDYCKGVLTEGVLQAVISAGRTLGIPVVVDPKGDDFGKYRGATLLTPNRKEAQTACRQPIVDEASLRRAGRTLLQDLELDALVLTRSEEGMTLFYQGGQEDHLPTEAREVFDVSGAGDTVLAFLGLGLATGMNLREAAQLANLAAGVVVAKVGTSTVSANEIVLAASRLHFDTDAKIRSRETVAGLLEGERQRGKTIVFTNGCFDLLHVGHVKYLQQARSLGQILVLGLNSDASIQRLKGPKRPLLGQEERAHILAALNCIDYVVIFEEDTPLELIRVLRPDILVKGGDYTAEAVVGRELVEGWGGRVELIQFVAGKSTSGTIERILEQYR